mmetsp:Transcript_10380/g.18371  ORF Transcript_10380/g.18371 Transcript_10380/m.18371 type:complete len:417 (+) Transcript_10380:93-1343(+)
MASSEMQLTPAGGKPHTAESRAKISAANKGKTPWNKGRKHSPETIARIKERTRIAMLKKKEKKALELGYESLEAYEEVLQKEKERKKKAGGPNDRTLSQETKKKISEKLKARWADPVYRATQTAKAVQNLGGRNGFRNRTHTEETRRQISEKVKAQWKNPEYREKLTKVAQNVSEETRQKISASLKARWENLKQNNQTAIGMNKKSKEHKKKIADAIRAKWADPEFRARMDAQYAERRAKRQKENPKPKKRARSPQPRASRLAKKEGIAIPEEEEEEEEVRVPVTLNAGTRIRLSANTYDQPVPTKKKSSSRRQTRKYAASKPQPRTSETKLTLEQLKFGVRVEQSEEDFEKSRVARMKIENYDLWAALYADDVELSDDNADDQGLGRKDLPAITGLEDISDSSENDMMEPMPDDF